MMQVNEIQRHFSNIERSVDQVTQACRSERNIPQDLQECVQQLDRQTEQARQVLQSQDESRIRQCIDNLEQISDRAEHAIERANDLDDGVKRAVMQAHSELSSLKHQLH